MSLQNLIANKLDTSPINKLSMLFGCSDLNRLSERLECVINDNYMGLDSNLFDLRYSNTKFLIKLCEILKIPSLLCETVINEIKAELLLKMQKFKPYLFIETEFKRTNEPIFVLSALESNRYIYPDSETSDLSLNDQLDSISEQIKSQHLKQPVIELWGKAKRYVYFYNKKTVLIFSVAGELIDATDSYSHSKASLRLK